VVVLAACEEERRVPYIPPELHNWEQPYRGRSDLELHAFDVGTLTKKAGSILGGGGGKKTKGRGRTVWAYVLKHPSEGLVIIDTGLNHQLGKKGKKYLGGLLAMTVEASLEPEQCLPAQMRAAGFNPEEVRWVVVSNLRFYHTGELESFEQATVVVSKAEHRHALEQPSGYLRREFDDVTSWKFVDVRRDGKPLGAMPAALDLFGDGICMLIDAPGPTAGNLAVLLPMADRPLLLAGDFAPFEQSVRHARPPTSLEDRDAWWDHIWRLKRFGDLEPALLIVPGYSTKTVRSASLKGVHWHEFDRDQRTPTD
jgi:glyoxylase-like metal-dependent hydrolase (beta-lactamase superfamily II)